MKARQRTDPVNTKKVTHMVKRTTNPYKKDPFQISLDGWVNMRKATRAFGKSLEDFFDSHETQIYVDALRSLPEMEGVPLVICDEDSTTWGHPKLYIFFIRWLDPKASVACDIIIHEMIKDGSIRKFIGR